MALSLAEETGTFKLTGPRKAAFISGIQRTVEAASAIVLTRGFDVGEAKAIGQAVGDAQYVIQDNEEPLTGITLLGITSWAAVRNRGQLINQYDEFGVNKVVK